MLRKNVHPKIAIVQWSNFCLRMSTQKTNLVNNDRTINHWSFWKKTPFFLLKIHAKYFLPSQTYFSNGIPLRGRETLFFCIAKSQIKKHIYLFKMIDREVVRDGVREMTCLYSFGTICYFFFLLSLSGNDNTKQKYRMIVNSFIVNGKPI